MSPNFEYELEALGNGHKVIAGADEVGRGAFAGPVVAATIVFTPSLFKNPKIPVRIDDSKKLTKKQREKSAVWIKENSLWGVGKASVEEINKHGIKGATFSGFRRSVYRAQQTANSRIEFLLVDGFLVPYIRNIQRNNQKAIIRGDTLSLSIAAASIVAKVYRDDLMKKLAKKHDQYHWHSNVGYGTPAHREAILQHGPCIHHRRDFIKNTLKKA